MLIFRKELFNISQYGTQAIRENNKKIEAIDNLSFKFFENLIEIDLFSNKIFSISKDSFSFLNCITKINLGHNLIKELHNQTFNGLVNLREIDLSFNKIEVIDEALFLGLKNLPRYLFQHLKAIDRLIKLTGKVFSQTTKP